MGAVGSVGSGDNWLIQKQQDEHYQLLQDVDGDGVADNSTVMSEAEINTFLQAQGAGFLITGGEQVPLDGYVLDDSIQYNPIVDFDVPPPLPVPSGATLPPAKLRERLNGAEEISDAALMWMTLLTLAETSAQDLKNARISKSLAHEQKAGFKHQEIRATENKIEKDKDAAQMQFWISVGSAAASFALSFGGALLSSANAGATAGDVAAREGASRTAYAVGKGMEASGTAFGQVISAGGNWINTEFGPKAEANRLEMRAKRYAMAAEAIDQVIEEKADTIKAVDEHRKQALRILDEHCDRETQLTRQIFS